LESGRDSTPPPTLSTTNVPLVSSAIHPVIMEQVNNMHSYYMATASVYTNAINVMQEYYSLAAACCLSIYSNTMSYIRDSQTLGMLNRWYETNALQSQLSSWYGTMASSSYNTRVWMQAGVVNSFHWIVSNTRPYCSWVCNRCGHYIVSYSLHAVNYTSSICCSVCSSTICTIKWLCSALIESVYQVPDKSTTMPSE